MDSEAVKAVKQSNLERLKQLIDQSDMCIDEKDAKGQTLLHIAVDKNDDAMVDFILEKVARKKLRTLLNAKTSDTGTTALHIAVKNDFYKQAEVLLQFGANFEVENDNGEKPIDLADNRSGLRDLLEQIDDSFAKAKSGDEQLIDNLRKCDDTQKFGSVVNCRNNEDHTIMQVLILNQPDQLSCDLLYLRVTVSVIIRGIENFHEIGHKSGIDKLAKQVNESEEFWDEHSQANAIYVESIRRKTGRPPNVSLEFVALQVVIMCCRSLEKAHDALLAYRKFVGKEKSLTSHAAMRTVEEVLEILEFDPDELHVVVGDENCYYNKLPIRWKNDFENVMSLLDGVVYAAITYFKHSLNRALTINAINNDDIDTIKNMLNSVNVTDGFDQTDDKAILTYALERGNKDIICLFTNFKRPGAYSITSKGILSSMYLAVCKGNAKVVKILLSMKNYDVSVEEHEILTNKALHEAVKNGQLKILKILLSYGATYSTLDAEGGTLLDFSTNQEVSDFLKLVDGCFNDAKKADIELVYKLKSMPTKDFLAVAGCKNLDGLTLAIVAAKANAKSTARVILKMIKEAADKM